MASNQTSITKFFLYFLITIIACIVLIGINCSSDTNKNSHPKSNGKNLDFGGKNHKAFVDGRLFYNKEEYLKANKYFAKIDSNSTFFDSASQFLASLKVINLDSIILENQKAEDTFKARADEIKVKEDKKWFATKAGKIQKKHPSWTIEDCKKISEGRYWIGMHYDMLVLSLGKRPDHVNPSDYGSGVSWQWCWDGYTPSCFYAESDKIISSYN